MELEQYQYMKQDIMIKTYEAEEVVGGDGGEVGVLDKTT